MKNINISQYQYQPFHLVTISPWPILVAFSMLTMTTGAVAYMHGFQNGGAILTLGFVLTGSGMILWFRDIILEATVLGDHTKEVVTGLVYGIVLFIISEAFAFLSIFWAFFHSALAPAIEIGGSWPPLGVDPLNPFSIPLLNTLLLLSSGAFITWAHHALINCNRAAAINGTFLTIILAIIFTGFQVFEYIGSSFSIADSVFGSAFFCATGLHGFHVIIGTIFITVGFIRIINYHLTSSHHQGFEAAIYYWHFVDVVWVILFIAVYIWGGTGL